MKLIIREKIFKITACILLLFLVTSIIFIYTVQIRTNWFRILSYNHHQWLTGGTLKFSKNWYRDGAINDKFLMLEQPKSIESPTLISREPYLSYPSGTIIPIYLLSKIINQEPTAAIIMGYNLFNHFLIAFFLSLIIFFFLLSIDFDYKLCFGFSLIPIFLELLMPGPLYWHQNVFFADQAVILPFVIFIFLEVIGDLLKKKVYLNILQILVMFWGLLTDPTLFFFVVLFTYLKRLFFQEHFSKKYFILNTFLFLIIPILLLIFLYCYIPYSLNQLSFVTNKFLFRAGLGSSDVTSFLNYLNPLTTASLIYNPVYSFLFPNTSGLIDNGISHSIYQSAYIKIFLKYLNPFWQNHFTISYGSIAITLIWESLALIAISLIYILYCFFFKKKLNFKIKKITALIAIILLPCLVQIYVFRGHSVVHDFSALKFSIPMALIPFVLSPILILLILQENILVKKIKLISDLSKKYLFNILFSILFVSCFLIALSYIINIHDNYKNFFPSPHRDIEKIGSFIDSNTGYKDIIFSPDFEIVTNPPQLLSYSMKLVYRVNSVSDIYNKVKDIKEDYDINLFFVGDIDFNRNNEYIKKLTEISYKNIQNENMILYKIKKDVFLNQFNTNYLVF